MSILILEMSHHIIHAFSLCCFPTGVTVYQPSLILNQSEIIMMFQSGVGVEVVENKGYMAARVYLPWEYIVSS